MTEKVNIHLCKETMGTFNKVYFNPLMKWWDVMNVNPHYKIDKILDIKYCPFCGVKL